MNQLADFHRPTVEVTIKPELRALLATRFEAPVEAAAEPPAKTGETASSQCEATAPWKMVCLRRDGARPCRFTGMKVFETSRQTQVKGVLVSHVLTLFQERRGDLFCALRMTPDDPLNRRPCYWCEPVPDVEHFMMLTHRWACDVLCRDEIEDDEGDPPLPDKAFNDLTAQALQKASMH